MRFQAPESLAEQIAQHVGKLIITGHLKPGERIQELKVAKELDVSRGSVREALLLLERRHLIEIYPRRGAVVSDLTPDNVSALYDMYAGLLVILGSKFAVQWQESELRMIASQVDKINKITKDSEDVIEKIISAGFTLMESVLDYVANPYLTEMVLNLRPAIHRTYFLAMKSHKEELMQNLSFYNGVFQRVTQRDIPGVKQVIDDFADHQKALVISLLEDRSAA